MSVIPAGIPSELITLLRENTGATVSISSTAGSSVTGVLVSLSDNLAKIEPSGAPPVYCNINYIVQVTIETPPSLE